MPKDSDALVPLTSTPNESRAAMIVAALKDGGIEAFTEGGLLANFRGESYSEVDVKVREKDLAAARVALAEFKEVMSEIDWDQVDVGERE